MKLPELEIAKTIIRDNISAIYLGIFNYRNVAGDEMTDVYSDDYIDIDICYDRLYVEVLGLSRKDFEELVRYYHEVCADFLNSKHGARS